MNIFICVYLSSVICSVIYKLENIIIDVINKTKMLECAVLAGIHFIDG